MWSHKTGSRLAQVVARPVLTVCARKRIYHECKILIVKSVTRQSLVMPNGDPGDSFVDPHLTLMGDSYILGTAGT